MPEPHTVMSTETTARRLQFPRVLLRSLVAAVAAERSAADAVQLLRQAGYDAGTDLFQLLQDRIAETSGSNGVESLPASQFWESFTSLWESLQWGTMEHRQSHPAVAEIVSSNWVEAEVAPEGLGCHVTTGMLADLLGRIAGQDVALLETECRSRGDAQCRFLVGSPDMLDSVYNLLQNGASPDDALAQLF